jgi:hypothetical protein
MTAPGMDHRPGLLGSGAPDSVSYSRRQRALRYARTPIPIPRFAALFFTILAVSFGLALGHYVVRPILARYAGVPEGVGVVPAPPALPAVPVEPISLPGADFRL